MANLGASIDLNAGQPVTDMLAPTFVSAGASNATKVAMPVTRMLPPTEPRLARLILVTFPSSAPAPAPASVLLPSSLPPPAPPASSASVVVVVVVVVVVAVVVVVSGGSKVMDANFKSFATISILFNAAFISATRTFLPVNVTDPKAALTLVSK